MEVAQFLEARVVVAALHFSYNSSSLFKVWRLYPSGNVIAFFNEKKKKKNLWWNELNVVVIDMLKTYAVLKLLERKIEKKSKPVNAKTIVTRKDERRKTKKFRQF